MIAIIFTKAYSAFENQQLLRIVTQAANNLSEIAEFSDHSNIIISVFSHHKICMKLKQLSVISFPLCRCSVSVNLGHKHVHSSSKAVYNYI